MGPYDRSDELREAVELAQAEFSRACEPGSSREEREKAAIKLERAVVRLNDYILRSISPADPGEE